MKKIITITIITILIICFMCFKFKTKTSNVHFEGVEEHEIEVEKHRINLRELDK